MSLLKRERCQKYIIYHFNFNKKKNIKTQRRSSGWLNLTTSTMLFLIQILTALLYYVSLDTMYSNCQCQWRRQRAFWLMDIFSKPCESADGSIRAADCRACFCVWALFQQSLNGPTKAWIIVIEGWWKAGQAYSNKPLLVIVSCMCSFEGKSMRQNNRT